MQKQNNHNPLSLRERTMFCPECGKKMSLQKVPYCYQNIFFFGEFEAEVCDHCGAVYFKEKSVREIVRLAKEYKKIWSIERPLEPEKRFLTASKKEVFVTNLSTVFETPTYSSKKKMLISMEV